MATTTQTLEPVAAEEQREAPRTAGWRRLVAKRDPVALWLGALAVLLGAGFVVVDIAYNQGKLIAPLDDVYIHMQYGSQLGQGHFFQYNNGDPVSTGASSILYALLLGAAYAVGFHGSFLLVFAVGFGILCYALTVMGIYKLGSQLVGKQAGIWTGVLVAVSGPLVWGSTSGMEVSLAAVLIVGTLLAFVKEAPGHRFVRTPLLGILLALVRPEGLIFAAALCGAMWWMIFTAVRRQGVPRATGLRSAVWVVLPLAAGAGQLLFYKLATGTTQANGIQSKSMLYDQPVFYFESFLDRVFATLRSYADTFNGISTREFFFPGALFLFVLGAAYLVTRRSQWRPLVIAILVGSLAIFGSVSTMNSALWHSLRYVQPLIPVYLLFIVAAVYGIARILPHPQARRAGPHAVLAIALAFSLIALPNWALRLGRQSATIRDSVVSAGGWINGSLPKDARIGVLDVGAIAYFGDRYIIDIIGLATNNLAAPHNNGAGAVYEALRHMPAGQRPDHYAIYQGVGGRFIDDMKDAGLVDQKPLLLSIAQTPNQPGEGRVTPYDRIEVLKADWTLAGSGDAIRASGTVRDYLNVGDLDAEKAHGYAPHMSHVGVQPHTVIKRVGDVLDSGRWIVGGETFNAGNLVPGKTVTITSRAEIQGEVAESQVLVNGTPVGTWQRKSGEKTWNESTFTIPGEHVTGSSISVELKPVRPLLGPYPQYTSYGYWLSQ